MFVDLDLPLNASSLLSASAELLVSSLMYARNNSLSVIIRGRLWTARSMHVKAPRAGSGFVRMDPLRFLAGCRTRRLNQAYSVYHILACCILVLWFIRDPFYVLLVFVAVLCCLLVVLVELSVLAKWLARKTPLRKPNRVEGIISIKPRPKSAHDFLGLLYCFIVLLCMCVVSCPYVIYYPTVMARYSLFVLKVPLNTKQTNKQTST